MWQSHYSIHKNKHNHAHNVWDIFKQPTQRLVCVGCNHYSQYILDAMQVCINYVQKICTRFILHFYLDIVSGLRFMWRLCQSWMNQDLKSLLLIGNQHKRQPIRSHFRKSLLVNTDLIMVLFSNAGKFCGFSLLYDSSNKEKLSIIEYANHKAHEI